MNRPRLFLVVPLATLALTVGAAAAPASAAASGTFTATDSMNAAHTEGKATLLPNGQVLVTGGMGSAFGSTLSSADCTTRPPGSSPRPAA